MRISDWSSDVCSSDLQAAGQLLERDIQRRGDAAGVELVLGTDVQYGDEAGLHPLKEVRPRHRLQAVPLPEIAAHNRANLGRLALAEAPQRLQQVEDRKSVV